MKENYGLLCQSLLEKPENWSKEMKFLIPAMGTYLVTVICKFPEYANQQQAHIQSIVVNLMQPTVRMEQIALKICAAFFEKVGNPATQ